MSLCRIKEIIKISSVTTQCSIFCPFLNRRKEGNVLFIDALNILIFLVICHRTYGKGPLTIKIVREENCCRPMSYSFQLAARVLLYEQSHRQDSTYHSLCYTSRGALARTRNF